MNSGSFGRFVFLILFSTIFSMLIGYLLVSKSIFEIGSPDFQFISNGVLCGLFFGVMELKSLRAEGLTFFAALLVDLLIFTGSYISVPYILRDLFYVGSIFLSIKTYSYFINKYPTSMMFVRSFALAFIYGVINVVVVSLLFVINTKGGTPTAEFLYIIGRWACFIGIGSGLGIDLFLKFQIPIMKLVNK